MNLIIFCQLTLNRLLQIAQRQLVKTLGKVIFRIFGVDCFERLSKGIEPVEVLTQKQSRFGDGAVFQLERQLLQQQ